MMGWGCFRVGWSVVDWDIVGWGVVGWKCCMVRWGCFWGGVECSEN